MAVQMIGHPGTTQFIPPGQHPSFITQPVSVINDSCFSLYFQFTLYFLVASKFLMDSFSYTISLRSYIFCLVT